MIATNKTMEEINKTSGCEPIIVMKDVTVAHPEIPNTPLIKSVNWEVFCGEFWIIGGLGETGKTALLLTAAGVHKPLKGEVILFSKNTSYLSESELIKLRLRIGFVFEGSGNLFHNLTIQENVILPLRYHYECDISVSNKKANEMLDLVGMLEYRDKLPTEVPKQYLKRVALARALILSPEVLFVDDPLKNLDVSQEQWWIEILLYLLKEFKSANGTPLTLIVTVSDLRPWITYNHKVALIHQNEYKCLGEKDLVYQNPDPYLAKLLMGTGGNG